MGIFFVVYMTELQNYLGHIVTWMGKDGTCWLLGVYVNKTRVHHEDILQDRKRSNMNKIDMRGKRRFPLHPFEPFFSFLV